MRILDSMASVPPVQKMFLRGEELLSDPGHALAVVGVWLGINIDDAALASMLDAKVTPSADDTTAARAADVDPLAGMLPALDSDQDDLMDLDRPLSWSADLVFHDRLKQLAGFLGY